MMRDYEGRKKFKEWLRDVGQVEYGTVSPGGVSAMLGVSRPMAHKLIYDTQELDSWVYRDGFLRRVHYCEVSVESVVRYAQRVGRPLKQTFGVDLSGDYLTG